MHGNGNHATESGGIKEVCNEESQPVFVVYPRTYKSWN